MCNTLPDDQPVPALQNKGWAADFQAAIQYWSHKCSKEMHMHMYSSSVGHVEHICLYCLWIDSDVMWQNWELVFPQVLHTPARGNMPSITHPFTTIHRIARGQAPLTRCQSLT
jgi:hypothetical protein